jgi:hypothetical protein
MRAPRKARMQRRMRRAGILLASMVAVGTTFVFAGTAGAGQPNNQACVGKSVSALASNQPAPGAFGQFVRGFAQNPGVPTLRPGLGDAIQVLQAGEAPDAAVPNTCND